MTWRSEAACVGHDPELWFPKVGAPGVEASARAKEVCAGCPVAASCLAEAVAGGVRYGVWGGLSPADRPSAPLVRRETRAERWARIDQRVEELDRMGWSARRTAEILAIGRTSVEASRRRIRKRVSA